MAAALQAETEALDEAYFAAADAQEGGGVTEFFSARLGAAIGFAVQAAVDVDAAAESIYEAAMASDTPEVALSAAYAVLR